MKTTVIKTNCTVVTNRILNGFFLTNFTYGYDELPNSSSTGIGIITDGTITVRVFNGVYAKYESYNWTPMTPTQTYTIGEDTVNEYVYNDSSRGYYPSKSATRVEYTTDGTYIWPVIRPSEGKYANNIQIGTGSWLNLFQVRMDVSPLNMYEPISIKEWSDMIHIDSSLVDSGSSYQIRFPRNMTGAIEDLALVVKKCHEAVNYPYLYSYASYLIGNSLSTLVHNIAQDAAAGKKVYLHIYSLRSDPLYDKTITFDGEGGYSYPNGNNTIHVDAQGNVTELPNS